jgi:hypothetical protein
LDRGRKIDTPTHSGCGQGLRTVGATRSPTLNFETADHQGRQDFCYTGDFTERGIKQRHGHMMEFVVEKEVCQHRYARSPC